MTTKENHFNLKYSGYYLVTETLITPVSLLFETVVVNKKYVFYLNQHKKGFFNYVLLMQVLPSSSSRIKK